MRSLSLKFRAELKLMRLRLRAGLKHLSPNRRRVVIAATLPSRTTSQESTPPCLSLCLPPPTRETHLLLTHASTASRLSPSMCEAVWTQQLGSPPHLSASTWSTSTRRGMTTTSASSRPTCAVTTSPPSPSTKGKQLRIPSRATDSSTPSDLVPLMTLSQAAITKAPTNHGTNPKH